MATRISDLPVDGSRFQLRSTGIVNSVEKYSEDRSAPRVQDSSTEGVPLWEIECLRQIEDFGKRHTETIQVRLPSATEPVVPEGSPRFAALTVSATIHKASGQLRIYWTASGVESVPSSSGPARSTRSAE